MSPKKVKMCWKSPDYYVAIVATFYVISENGLNQDYIL